MKKSIAVHPTVPASKQKYKGTPQVIVDKLEKRSGLLYKAKEKFKSIDMFGQKPRLTWNGEE